MNRMDAACFAGGAVVGTAVGLTYAEVTVPVRPVLISASLLWIAFLAIAFARGLMYGE